MSEFSLLDHIEKVAGLAGNKGMNTAFFEESREHLDAVSGVLHISPVQAALFALLLELSGEGAVSMDKIASASKCGRIQLIKYMDDFEALEQKKLIRAVRGRNSIFEFGVKSSGGLPSYSIPLEVIKAVRRGVAYQREDYERLTPEDFFETVDQLLEAVTTDDLSLEDLISEIYYLFELNQGIAFVQKQKEYDLAEGSVVVMLSFCCALLHKDEELLTVRSIQDIVGRHETRQIERRFESGEHKLIKKGCIENNCRNGLADIVYYRLTQKAKDEFLADVNIKEKAQRHGKNIINAKSLPVKKLFYSEKIRRSIGELRNCKIITYENYERFKT